MTDPMQLMAQQIGARLREARQEAAFTVRAAATAIGITHTTLVRYENGQVVPSIERLFQLAHVYETTPAALLAPSSSLAHIIRTLAREDPAMLHHIEQRFT